MQVFVAGVAQETLKQRGFGKLSFKPRCEGQHIT